MTHVSLIIQRPRLTPPISITRLPLRFQANVFWLCVLSMHCISPYTFKMAPFHFQIFLENNSFHLDHAVQAIDIR